MTPTPDEDRSQKRDLRETDEDYKGPVAYMAKHKVAANLLMAVLVIGGLRMAKEVRQEVFPDLEIDMVSVTIAYPGASPAQVESGVVLVIEFTQPSQRSAF
ncbi:MAG TPA: efflux RND transporter permease subunit, partial [Microbacterium sp.]|nr:efflux RND transporter permease subunit [Microbacterium sp.]